jgi:DNA-binding CsgD family transcriptional regulator
MEMIYPIRKIVKKPTKKEAVGYSILSTQEINCIKLLSIGMNCCEIGEKLDLSKRTVEHYLEHAKNKICAKNNVELVFKCVKIGVL